MTDKKKFKNLVRERMARTGETYTTAKRNLERILTEGSSASPDVPSGLSEFEQRRREFRQRALSDWRKLTEGLAGVQATISWTGVPEIVNVLSRIGNEARRNHTLFPPPGGGGLDLFSAAASHESNCIELRFENQTVVVRPIALRLHMFERDPLRDWAFFMLDTGGLAPSGIYGPRDGREDEEVLEVSPGKYVDANVWYSRREGDDDGEPLPPSARLISRHYGGPFLFMAKGATYITIDKYVGDHGNMSPDEFRSLFERLISLLHQRGTYGKDLLLNGR